ncbi:MAG: M64 family metallopeptidase [Acidobacteriota bacterium]
MSTHYRLVVVLLMLGLAVTAHAGDVLTLRQTGPDDERIVVAIVAEGYTADQTALFESDLVTAVDGLFAITPYREYESWFNVYGVFVASNESGADKPEECFGTTVERDTAFDATYCTSGIRRLLTVNRGAVLAELNTSVPGWDVSGAMVNDGEYGGSGGPTSVFSTNGASIELFAHEAGHSFPRLADEYAGNPGVGSSAPEVNVTVETVLGLIEWSVWIDADTPLPTPSATRGVVGAYEGGRYFDNGIFRPIHDCKMRSLDRPFGEVCREAHVQHFHALVDIIETETPESATAVEVTPCVDLDLALTLLSPAPDTLTVTWTLDGVVLDGETGPTLSLASGLLTGASHELVAEVRDATAFVRRPYLTPMTSTRTWTLSRADGGAADLDTDGIEDACDPDIDGDGLLNEDDCSPREALPHAELPEVTDLRASGRSLLDLTWTSLPELADRPDGRYGVLRGVLEDLHVERDFRSACRIELGSEAGASVLAGSLSVYYLLVALDSCGPGPLGVGSSGPRTVDWVALPDCP